VCITIWSNVRFELFICKNGGFLETVHTLRISRQR
jgi:hypothetical protein